MRAVSKDAASFEKPSTESQTASATVPRPRVMLQGEDKIESGADFERQLALCGPCRRRGRRTMLPLKDLTLGKCPDCFAAWEKRMIEGQRSRASTLLACADATGSEACRDYGQFLMETLKNDKGNPSSDPRWHRQGEANEHLKAWEESNGN